MAMALAGDVREVSTPHGTVRLRDSGTGTPVLLVHSLLVDGGLYEDLVGPLVARGFRCLVPDLPLGAHLPPMRAGADLTPPGLAVLLTEVLEAAGVDRVAVVGVDTGGALTQLLMAHHRDRVGRIVLTACDAYEAFPPRLLTPLLAPLRTALGTWLLAQSVRTRLVRRLITSRPVAHARVADEVVQRWTRPLREPAIRRDLRAVVAGVDSRYTVAAAEANLDFPHPVLVAWGDDDRVFPRRFGERLANDLPHAELVTIADCAAFAALDQPQKLADLISAHLKSPSPSV